MKINQKICEIIREFKLYQKKYKKYGGEKHLVNIDKNGSGGIVKLIITDGVYLFIMVYNYNVKYSDK